MTGVLEPVSEIVRGEPAVSSVIVSVAFDVPARGVYVTSMVQVVPGAKLVAGGVVVQVSVSEKSAAFVPPSVTPLTFTGAEPVLV